jgi:hypothetical protein
MMQSFLIMQHLPFICSYSVTLCPIQLFNPFKAIFIHSCYNLEDRHI